MTNDIFLKIYKTIREKEEGPGFEACLTLGLRMPSMHVTWLR